MTSTLNDDTPSRAPTPPQSSDTLPSSSAKPRKTHLNDTVSDFLKSLPKAKKVALNKEKSARNIDRGLKRVYHQADPTTYPDDASDVSSLITVSSEGSSAPPRFPFRSPSPKSFFASIFSKRDRDLEMDNSPEAKEKRRRRDTTKEVPMTPGVPTAIGFHSYHFELCKYEIYIPLSLFTNANLRIINRDSSSLTLKKINPKTAGSKPPQVLDTAHFEKRYGREEELSHQAWIEAARNYVRFAAETGVGGEGGDWHKRWDDHFGFLESRVDAVENFPAILELDIRLRKDYNVTPFVYEPAWYEREYEKAKTDYRLRRVENEQHPKRSDGDAPWLHPFRSLAKLPSPSRFLGGEPGGRGANDRGSPFPFRMGSGGDPASAVCLICARRGHTFSACGYNTLEDGKAVFATCHEGNLQTVKGSHALCRDWNIRGDSDRACLHRDARVHQCSFCGDKQHHAFAWICRKAPPSTP